ncbi:tRNA lysidine(34) synthetase TilS [Corynebacterium uropygiale]|uniref:tRNA(Ile)-lysidine synthase n=1 Tax=Corynebacterium uropygiale TaxID=1775911 RepID=A0A9X1QPJ5_9CORY|nr:tRNA lysidine(34) synthetase TilS [Corynebacterium uropygiale]MCF4007212.1 tRNA lysidine(34) synthetase TilS [Corynebacterium uropygiale]
MSRLRPPARSPHLLACRQAVRRAYAGGRITVGLSGGPDSLALSAAIAAEGLPAQVLCVDHGLQGGSDAIAREALRRAREWGLDGSIRTLDLPAGPNMEARARDARYQALAQAAGGGEIWVAHTAEDNAETLLLGALRGNPAGMAVRRGSVVRPLLALRRADTEGACRELGVSWWRDPHNGDPAYRRVALRQRVLPLLGEITGGDPIPALARAAAKIAEDDAFLQGITPDARGLSCEDLAELAPAVRRRALADWLRDQGIDVTQAAIEGVERLCTQWRGQGPVAVGGDRSRRIVVRRRGGRLETSAEPR